MQCLLSSHTSYTHTHDDDDDDAISTNIVFNEYLSIWPSCTHCVLHGWMDGSSDFNENKQEETKKKDK